MQKRGFASMYLVYSFFLIFITMMLSILMVQNYKKSFLNKLKSDIQLEVQNYHLETLEEISKNQE